MCLGLGCPWVLGIAGGEGMEPGSSGRMAVALVVLALLAVLVWRTMEAGRYQQLTWLLIAFFAFRVVLARLKAR